MRGFHFRFFCGRHPHRIHDLAHPGYAQRICLADLSAGQQAVILDFTGGRMVNKRLASLGFTPGVQVSMTQNYGHGPLIVTVRGTRVALGRGEAARILVEMDTHERLSR